MAGIWAIVGILVVVALILLEFKDLKHRMLLIVVLVALGFLVTSVGIVYFAHDIDLKSFDGIVEATKIYFIWLGNFFDNVGDATGYVINQDWSANFTTK
jgi:hypothetical protein